MSVVHDTRVPQVSFWNNPKMRGVVVQAIVVLALVAVGYELYSNARVNLGKLGKTFGYEFWNQSSGFDILVSLIPYTNASSYGTAIIVGFLNTLLVAVLGIFLQPSLALLQAFRGFQKTG